MLRWKYRTVFGVVAAPSISVDGVIFFGSWDSYMRALLPSGALLWEFKTGSGVVSSASIALGGIMFGSNDRHVYSIDARCWKPFHSTHHNSVSCNHTLLILDPSRASLPAGSLPPVNRTALSVQRHRQPNRTIDHRQQSHHRTAPWPWQPSWFVIKRSVIGTLVLLVGCVGVLQFVRVPLPSGPYEIAVPAFQRPRRPDDVIAQLHGRPAPPWYTRLVQGLRRMLGGSKRTRTQQVRPSYRD